MDQLRGELDRERLSAVHPGVEQHIGEPVWLMASALLANPAFDGLCSPIARRWSSRALSDCLPTRSSPRRALHHLLHADRACRRVLKMAPFPAPTMTLLQTMVPGSSRQVSDLIAGLRLGGMSSPIKMRGTGAKSGWCPPRCWCLKLPARLSPSSRRRRCWNTTRFSRP